MNENFAEIFDRHFPASTKFALCDSLSRIIEIRAELTGRSSTNCPLPLALVWLLLFRLLNGVESDLIANHAEFASNLFSNAARKPTKGIQVLGTHSLTILNLAHEQLGQKCVCTASKYGQVVLFALVDELRLVLHERGEMIEKSTKDEMLAVAEQAKNHI